MDKILEAMCGACPLSTLDLKSGYLEIPIREVSPNQPSKQAQEGSTSEK